MRYYFFSETVFLLDIKSEKYYIALGFWHHFPEVGLGAKLKGLRLLDFNFLAKLGLKLIKNVTKCP